MRGIKGVPHAATGEYLSVMGENRKNQIAVIFASMRTDFDADGYEQAAEAMAVLASQQPGYRGVQSARGGDGFGITVSYWADEAAATAWRDHPEHSAIRDMGRARWYSSYSLEVATISRAYDWQEAASDG